jgi:hypothetical protein
MCVCYPQPAGPREGVVLAFVSAFTHDSSYLKWVHVLGLSVHGVINNVYLSPHTRTLHSEESCSNRTSLLNLTKVFALNGQRMLMLTG